MATQNVDVSDDPSNLVSGHSLTVGTRYSFQNVDANARIFLRQAAVKPTGGALRGYVLEPGKVLTVEPMASVGVWVWTYRTDGAKAVITEAP